MEDLSKVNDIFKDKKVLVVGSGISICDNESIFNNYYYTCKHKNVFISDVNDNFNIYYDFNHIINNSLFADIRDKMTLSNIEDTYPKTYSKYKNKKKLTKNYYRSLLKEKFIKLDLLKNEDIDALEFYDVIHLRYVLHLRYFRNVSRINIIKSLYDKLNKNGTIYIQNYINSGIPYHHFETESDISELMNLYPNKINITKFLDDKNIENVIIELKK